MKVGDLVRWKQSSFINDDYGIIVEVPDMQVAESQFDSGELMVTVLWNDPSRIASHSARWRIRAHYLEVVNGTDSGSR
tara:strand:- start:1112 stop:1345 length:234 start_codon:yes stop_codon:yes gene_type:complete